MSNSFLSDALFIGAHPDDGELLAGGLIANMTRRGQRVVLIDATRGEMGTRGTVEERAGEAADAAAILGVQRENLALPDGGIGHDREASLRAIVSAIRRHRPRLLFTHSDVDHHPDHNALSQIVRQAFFTANLLKYDAGHERHATRRLFYFWSHRTQLPDQLAFIADVTDSWEQKIASIKAHRTQFAGGLPDGPATYLTSDIFWHRLEARFAYFGSLIGTRYGEPYQAEGILRIDDPVSLPDVT